MSNYGVFVARPISVINGNNVKNMGKIVSFTRLKEKNNLNQNDDISKLPFHLYKSKKLYKAVKDTVTTIDPSYEGYEKPTLESRTRLSNTEYFYDPSCKDENTKAINHRWTSFGLTLCQEKISLSRREVEVMYWTSLGKTADDISGIIGISTRTVNFHIANTMTKLNANNKTSAAVKMMLLGFFSNGDRHLYNVSQNKEEPNNDKLVNRQVL